MKYNFNYFVRLSAFTCIVLLLTACKPNPQDDISLFKSFISRNIHDKSDNPFVSSTFKPGDKMYDILVNIQHGQHTSAEVKLKELIKHGDVDAMFWYAKMTFGDSIYSAKPAVELFEKSAELGNPYSALMLSPSSYGCLYYKSKCDKKWLDKAVNFFEKHAKNGDLRSQYFLLKNKGLDNSKDTRGEYIKEIIRFSESHYYQPLMDYVDSILTRNREKGVYESKTTEQYDLAVSLLTIAANNNYIPAIDRLAFISYKKNVDEDLVEKGVMLGSTGLISYKYNHSENTKTKYFYNALYKKLSGHYVFDINQPDEYLRLKIDQDVDSFFKDIKSSIYIDGFTPRTEWVDR